MKTEAKLNTQVTYICSCGKNYADLAGIEACRYGGHRVGANVPALTVALDQCIKALQAAQKEIARGGHSDRWKTIHDYIEPAIEAAKKARG